MVTRLTEIRKRLNDAVISKDWWIVESQINKIDTLIYNHKEYYTPLFLKIIGYSTPKDFANSEHKPFGEIPDEYWKDYVGITNGKMVAFVTKNPNELHFYKEPDCSFDELIETIGHELGHLQPKISINLNEENKADRYGLFAKQVYEICRLIYEPK